MRFRIHFNKDSSIQDAFKPNFVTAGIGGTVRSTGSNAGMSETLQIFKSYGEITSGSLERSRILVQFDSEIIKRKMVSGSISSGSMTKIWMRMFNQQHGETIPTSYNLSVYPLSRSWDEGRGLDVINFADAGYANWLSASSTQGWTTSGSDFISTISASQHFDTGEEDLEVDISNITYEWMFGTQFSNNGLLVKLATTEEETNTIDYYIKRFHARNTHFQEREPYAYVEFDDSVQDHRKNFVYNLDNTLALYNRSRGALTNLAGNPNAIFVKVIDNLVSGSQTYSVTFTASKKTTGIYTGSIYVTSSLVAPASASTLYDIWYSGSTTFSTGTIKPIFQTGSFVNESQLFRIGMPNLKRIYDRFEEAKLRVVGIPYNYNPPVVQTGTVQIPMKIFDTIYYQIKDDDTREIVIPFGTGSTKFTRLSSDEQGNYFNFWMESLNHGRLYRFEFLVEENGEKLYLDDVFPFKVR